MGSFISQLTMKCVRKMKIGSGPISEGIYFFGERETRYQRAQPMIHDYHLSIKQPHFNSLACCFRPSQCNAHKRPALPSSHNNDAVGLYILVSG